MVANLEYNIKCEINGWDILDDCILLSIRCPTDIKARISDQVVIIGKDEHDALCKDRALLIKTTQAWKWACEQIGLGYDLKEYNCRFIKGMIEAFKYEISAIGN